MLNSRTIENTIVREIRLANATSRVQLAKQLGIAPSTMGIQIDRLVEQGILKESVPEEWGLGRPPKLLEPNPTAGQFIGVDFDARRLHAVSVDFSQQLLKQHSRDLPSQAKAADVILQIQEVIREVRFRGRKLLGIGLAIPGTLDEEATTGLHYRFISDWTNLPLKRIVQGAFRVPVYLENNVRVMAMAERWFGQARNIQNFICIGIRSGIGAGIFLNGELYRGSGGLAGEIGTWPVCDSSLNKKIQESIPLEDIASLRAILETLNTSVDGLLESAEKCDSSVLKILKIAACAVGRVISQISLMLNPQRIVIGGPLAELEEAFMSPLCEEVQRCLNQQSGLLPEIVSTQLGELAGAKGAAALSLHRWELKV
ncbi:MAG TPA: hypothetical protein DIW81_27435 [Planctomycetaceae bacterium]|nr:hypothetical protein [Rubinisphaera sp.]HCS55276.1 hypothetical protein [Planctomycetaceae bacterium]